MKRAIDLLVVSDVHLGTSACRAAELNAYLKSVRPARIILLGDIVDLWHIRRGFWSEDHTRVVRRLLKAVLGGTPVTWVTGNHDAALRRFSPLALGGLEITDRLELDLDGDRTWFLHGDAFDLAIGTGRLAGRLGGWSYDRLLMLNRGVNTLRGWFGLPPMSVAKRIAVSIPAARRHIARFEDACTRAAAERGAAAIVTGHIHHAADRIVMVDGTPVHLLNSGDWVESCTALEYAHGRWSLVRYDDLRAEGLVEDPRDADRTAEVLPLPIAG